MRNRIEVVGGSILSSSVGKGCTVLATAFVVAIAASAVRGGAASHFPGKGKRRSAPGARGERRFGEPVVLVP